MELINTNNSIQLSTKVIKARNFNSRLKGLMFSTPLTAQHCFWIPQCKSIHTCFMRFSLDVLFVNKNLKVIKIIKNLKPWSCTSFYTKADSVFEFNAGELNNIKVGDQLLLQKKE